ncbi:Protein Jade-2 [Microtus ochrogaster]|uniref:Protein Jade-2 n=1 Tax=Microtus ochrogaster TaxID=79684 RepID=A0A8J6KQG9_MICOH|nr:Protein Jade-2 [Microtus ochrogaster]
MFQCSAARLKPRPRNPGSNALLKPRPQNQCSPPLVRWEAGRGELSEAECSVQGPALSSTSNQKVEQDWLVESPMGLPCGHYRVTVLNLSLIAGCGAWGRCGPVASLATTPDGCAPPALPRRPQELLASGASFPRRPPPRRVAEGSAPREGTAEQETLDSKQAAPLGSSHSLGGQWMEEKRRKYSISSENSDTTDNLITAMKIPDSYQLSPDDYYILADPWRQEWEKGVQVPAGAEAIPEPVVRLLPPLKGPPTQVSPDSPTLGEGTHPDWPGGSRYDLDEIDAYWLELLNSELKEMERPELDELTLERVLEELETLCHQNMAQAIETQEGLGIEYDEDVVCDVCRSPEGEDGNEMVFCDKCNVCVHQACYGILKVPTGSWLCRTCALGVQPKCLLCPKRGGALKPTRSGTKWVHVSCALWIPEVSIGCPEKMEPITKISHIPASRWALSCSLCKECTGTCIQCSMPSCITAFHVTCAFDRGLEMRTILADNDEVKFKSLCQEHSDGGPRNEPTPEPVEPSQAVEDLEKVTLRKQRLQQLEENFYELVEPAEVAERLDLAEALVDFIYQYWKLKRRANANQPLLTPKTDEVDNLAQQEQDVLYRRLKLFTHLRQDLERVRNLCYMVTRRERTKHTICKLQEQIFHLQMKLMEQDLCREPPGRRTKGKRSDSKRKGREGPKGSSPEKKEKIKAGPESVLGQLGK